MEYGEEPGGIERWLALTDGLGLDREYVMSMRGALPATRFAVEAYVRFVVEQPLDSRRRILAHRAVRAENSQGSVSRECSSGYDFIDDMSWRTSSAA